MGGCYSFIQQFHPPNISLTCANLFFCSCRANNADMYAITACTLSSDAVCHPCTQCGANQYQTAACTPTTNRECKVKSLGL